MSSRDSILRAVRAARPADTALPEVPQAVSQFPSVADPMEAFIQAAAAAGAHVRQGARSELSGLVAAEQPGARRILSLVPEFHGTVQATSDPHDLADLDLLVCEAVLGVAENGAVWLPESRLGTRAALFLPAQVVVVLERGAVVADLHQAYARLPVGSEGFGVFVAGPSKTADIEQALVVGAHGPRGLTVILVD